MRYPFRLRAYLWDHSKQMHPMNDPANTIRTCRQCGCTDHNACVDADGAACWWVAPDLCSACSATEISFVGGYPAGPSDRPEHTKASSMTGEPSPVPPRSAGPHSADPFVTGKDAKVRRTPAPHAGTTAAATRLSDRANPPPVFESKFTEIMYAALRWREGGKQHSELMRVDFFHDAEELAARLIAGKQRGGRELTDIEVRRVF